MRNIWSKHFEYLTNRCIIFTFISSRRRNVKYQCIVDTHQLPNSCQYNDISEMKFRVLDKSRQIKRLLITDYLYNCGKLRSWNNIVELVYSQNTLYDTNCSNSNRFKLIAARSPLFDFRVATRFGNTHVICIENALSIRRGKFRDRNGWDFNRAVMNLRVRATLSCFASTFKYNVAFPSPHHTHIRRIY